jgi:peptidoglycan/LPS O-acetylase OafA/YrhL
VSGLWQLYARKTYRSDIQGIRAVSAILILAYHIWGGKVSGGVDVFFVVSGFLMTTVLLRRVAEEGHIVPLTFWAGIIRRIAPSAYAVLLGTFVLGFFFLPPQFWLVTINELLFAAAHLENFQLMRLSVDYLAKDNPASPFQQFWALSVQVQFYFLLPLIIGAGLFLSKKRGTLRPMAATVAAFCFASFLYSLFITSQAPSGAYFDTAARLWEFMVGALVAIALPYLRLSRRWATVASATGLAVLLFTGLLVPASLHFPGYIAALPVAGAVLLLIAGTSDAKPPVTRLLANRYLALLGGISFTVYLWHWPVLVYTQHALDTTSLNFLQGMGMIATAIVLAVITSRLVENPMRRLPAVKAWPSYALGAACFALVALPGLGARERVLSLYEAMESEQLPVFDGDLIELQNSAHGVSLPQFVAVGSDKSQTILNCLDGRACESGDRESDRIVALVGGSHAAQWEPLFSEMGKRYGFKLVTMVQMSCALGYQSHMDEACKQYNAQIVERLAQLNPAFVVTNSTRLSRRPGSPAPESVPSTYAQQWRKITALGLPVLGIRDNPWFANDPSLCVWNNPEAASHCARPISELYLERDPALVYEGAIPLFHSADFSALYCTQDRCPAVFENRLMYFDTHHLTRSYISYIGQALERTLRKQVPEFFAALNIPDTAPDEDLPGLNLPGTDVASPARADLLAGEGEDRKPDLAGEER